MRCIALILVSLATHSFASSAFNPNQLIVKLKKDVSKNYLKSQSVKVLDILDDELNLVLISNDSMMMLDTQIDYLQADDNIEYVQKNHYLTNRATNDPMFSKLWSLFDQAKESDINMTQAWENFGVGGKNLNGDDVVVAVVDGGVDLIHQDLKDNVWVNKKEIAGNGIDDDGNGYVDDINGWNAYANNGQVDTDKHGTHVAGIIGAKGNNSVGVVGVNWNVKIMGLSLFDFSTAEVLRAYNYVYKQKKLYNETNGAKGANVVSTNSSFGVDRADCTTGEYPAWNDVYNKMGEVGILSAAATINAGIDVDKIGDVPTGCSSPYIVTVTNTTIENAKNSSAGFGATTIDIGAPGTDIYSTLPENNYGSMTGTSMATPHVAGLIGYLHSVASQSFVDGYKNNPAQMALELKAIMLNNVDQLPTLKNTTVSGGRINAQKSASKIFTY